VYGGTDVNNYTITNQTSATGDINKKNVTLTSITADSKTYDGNATATVSSGVVTGTVAGETLSVSGTGTFNNKNFGVGKTVTVTDVTTLAQTDGTGAWGNYNLTTTGSMITTADINKKPITISGITVDSKTYDGGVTATANLSALTPSYLVNTVGVVANDDFAVTSVTGTFDNKNAGAGKTVALSNPVYGGTDVNNYTITNQTSATGDINKKNVTLTSITAESKTYDASAAATISAGVINGTIVGETLSVSGSGTFDNKNAGTGKTVTVSDVADLTKVNIANDPGNWSNYNLTTTGSMTTTADITPVNVTLTSITADSKTYDGNATATVSSGVVTGTVAGETLSVSGTGTFNNKNFGVGKTVTVTDVTTLAQTDGTGAWGNYTLTTAGSMTTTADIIKKPITISGITVDSKTYDGGVTATANLSALNAAYLTGTVGVVANDDFAVTSVTGTFDNKNAGEGKTVALSNPVYGGTDVNNYTITNQTSATGDITRKPVTISGITAEDKIYDGNVTARTVVSDLNAAYLTETIGIIPRDDFKVSSVTGTFDNKNVGSNKTVTLSNPVYAGVDVKNYAITNQSSTKASISRKPITIRGIAANDKVYDASTSATVDARALDPKASINTIGVVSSDREGNLDSILNFLSDAFSDDSKVVAKTNASWLYEAVGVVPGDDVRISTITGTFSDKNVGVRKTVRLAATYTGADVDNYDITDQATATASITPRGGLRSLNTDLYYDPTLNSDLTGQPPRIVTKSELPNYDFSGSMNREREQPNSTPMPQSIEPIRFETQVAAQTPQWIVEEIAALSPEDVSAIPSMWFSQLSTEEIRRLPETAIQKFSTDQLLILLPRLSARQLQQLLPQQRRAMLRLSQN
jgi:trimeric autotransporter adhesin